MTNFQDSLQAGVQLLLWPDIAGLAYLYMATLIAAGSIGREAWERWHRGMEARLRLEAEMTEVASETGEEKELRLESILQRYEGRQMARINRLRLAIRLGPSLGLIGTLIPMARALAELASGNLPGLARNMVNAFASTVLGITVSVIAYVLAATREAWVRADDRELRLHAEKLLSDAGKANGENHEIR